jgi:D-alanyl-D-alanine dipeptidase
MASAANPRDKGLDTRAAVFLAVFLASACVNVFPNEAEAGELPDGFVYVQELVPGIRVDLRYASVHNFLGCPIDGYVEPKCILTRDAAEALGKVQADLKLFGLGLKIFDAYRPQRAVNHFVRWAGDLEDQRMQTEYFPRVAKKDLFKEGYIAEKSGHSRGSTVDLTIVSLDSRASGSELDMGTGFDFFGPESWPGSALVSAEQRAHRMLLRMLMEKHDFIPYAREWWHFTLKKEPFPTTYFDFPVQ